MTRYVLGRLGSVVLILLAVLPLIIMQQLLPRESAHGPA